MAQTTPDTTLLPDSSGQGVKQQAAVREGGEVNVVEVENVEDRPASTPSTEKTSTLTPTDARPQTPPPRPSLVPLGSIPPQSSTLTPVAPHPKRFNAVNISKKFLKNASASSASSSSPSVSKSGSSAAARPSIQPAPPYSRLVTTKLTASPAVASSTAGWSRPSSVAPSPATVSSSPNSTSPLPTAPASQPSTTSAPQLPHAGKVILPQPRSSVAPVSSLQKDSGSSKPVWGNVKIPTVVPIRPDIQPNDFPTAAEVANVARKQAKIDDAKATTDTAAKQLRMEEADTFRGVHLDPNAHHWDEMEEDDDNFLAGVIEFGDGRQYKIESTEQQPAGASSPRAGVSKESPSGPVSKEDRFVDDFDRSWPKSRNSPASASREFPPPSAHTASPSSSPVISNATHSPQDSSRVLFNERSNRLEPYSQSHRASQGPFGSKRMSFHEGVADPRGTREGPQNVQVLQKPATGDFGHRGRRFSGSSGNFGSGPLNGFVGDRTKDHHGRRDAPPPSPRSQHQPPHAVDGGRDFSRRGTMGPPPVPLHATSRHPQEGGRQLPPHLSHVSPNTPSRTLPRDSRAVPSEPPLSGGLPSSSGRFPPPSPAHSHASLSLVSPAAAVNISLPLATPADLDVVRKDVMHSAAERAKQRRQQEEEEREAQKERARRKAAEIEEKIKAEEAERQKEKQALEAAKIAKVFSILLFLFGGITNKWVSQEKEAISIIEEAVKSVEISSKPTEDKPSDTASGKMPLGRQPSLKAVFRMAPPEPLRSAGLRRTPLPPRPAPLSPPPTSVSSQPESWRTRMNAFPSPAPRQIQTRQSPASANFIPSGPSAAEQVETIADGSQEDLEVVDFSDMGKFVGIPESPEIADNAPEASGGPEIPSKPPRPVAADFFDEPPSISDAVPASKKADFGVWRRKVSQDVTEPSVSVAEVKEITVEVKKAATSTQDHTTALNVDDSVVSETFTVAEISMASTKEPLTYPDHQQRGAQIVNVSSPSNGQRTSRSQPLHREPTTSMSALDDAMSRIKGVLSGMQAQEPPKDVAQTQVEPEARTTLSVHLPPQPHARSNGKERWIPPALRPRRFDDNDEPREVFLVTVLQPPRSPLPAMNSISVRLPSISRLVQPIHRKQLHAFSRPPFQARMDILSFDPPVYDMSRRDLSLNDVLFRRPPPGFKGKFRYRVFLPRFRGPKVNIPPAGPMKPAAFGRSTVADDASTWRKPLVTPVDKIEKIEPEATSLHTMSRSPPPDHTPPETTVASIPKTGDDSPAKLDGGQAARSRSQPKMPVGSAVAFIRDSRIDVVEADTKPLVNFIVGSQLEDSEAKVIDISKMSPAVEPSYLKQDGRDEHASRQSNGIAPKSSTSSEDKEAAPSLVASLNADGKNPDDSTDRILVTPPTHHSTVSWTRSSTSLAVKESPARAPDPEHLKAVWSQTSNKAGLHAVNSLEGIADDLTALPFTLQDVKSEDGETPPPSLPSAPSRMSLHEVTRAFQQVPTSSSTPNPPPHRASFSPPSTHAPVARPTTAVNYAYSPAAQNNMRPAYVPYPSQMMSHSPGPMMYHPMASSPVPSRMQVNGHTPLYSQPMWMTMPGPSPQGHSNMMRPVPSPYPPQMVTYPSAGYAPQPPSNMMPTTPQGQNGGRGRGMPIMSPVMSHAHAHPGSAMYSSSPVMLHAVQAPQNHGYMPMPTGRGQPRTENGQLPNPQPQHPPHNSHHLQQHGGFDSGPNSFAGPAW
ncbi:hypothetical protein M413DRAFT_22895 [Hebeloma cylindrosporum]|uniref:Uncharacterized protein n=1 Tax=Hebeloma cylindrosporum TaxID=76867 RepID=A0A0C3CI16_HEBCY|nr:hypothetical protein M413DRAFT_22895 [Hebeloma cylindrosporum h7]